MSVRTWRCRRVKDGEVERIALRLAFDPPEGFKGRYSVTAWATIVRAVLRAQCAERGAR